MGISAGGLVSGIDTDSLISGLLSLERRPITLLQQKEADYQAKISAYGSIKSVLSELNTNVSALTDSDTFDPTYKATTSNSDILKIATDDTSSPGTYNIIVSQLATTAQMTGNTYSLETSNVGRGTLQFKLGDGNRISVDIGSGNSGLDEIASAINASSAEVSASVLKVADSDYRLTITAKDTGEDIAYFYQEEGLTFSTTTQATATRGEIQTSEGYASDVTALNLTGTLTVNGNDIILSGTETLNDIQAQVDAIAGITATVNFDAASSEYSLDIENDMADGAVEITFADNSAGNGLSNLINPDATVAAKQALININGIDVTRTTNSIADLISGTTVELVSEDPLETLTVTVTESYDSVASKVESFVSSYNNAIDTLSNLQSFNESAGVGATLIGDGTTRVLQSGLRRLLFNTVDGVADAVNSMSHLGISFDSVGQLSFNSSTFTAAIEGNTTDVVNFFTQNTFGQKEGFAHQFESFLDGYLNSSGILAAKENGYNTSIERLKGQTERIETRVAKQEAILRNQFSNLEQLLSGYQSTQSFLSQQLTALSKVNVSA